MIKIWYEIDTLSEGLRVEQFLKRKLFSHQMLQSLKQEENAVFVNGIPVKMKDVLQKGDLLIIQREEKEHEADIFPLAVTVEMLYEDRDILVVNKPGHMSTHISGKNRTNTLQNALTWFYEVQGEPFVFRCMNRLDTDTSGLTIIAKHEICAGILYELGQRREVKREYQCVVEGVPEPYKGVIDVPVGRCEGKLLKMQADPQHGKRAVTHYEVMKTDGKRSLLRVWLDTGRTHQIRVHMQYIGCPIFGDPLYGKTADQENGQWLHAYRLSFPHPITGEYLTFESALNMNMHRQSPFL